VQKTDSYKTIKATSEGDYRERGSKFLSVLFSCINDDSYKEQLKLIKKAHPSARHFCFASVIGVEEQEHRSSDDGEPSGTAGLPILNQILSAEITNAAIVVVRYFGGTKLGKPGLIHAYKESARLAIEVSKPVIVPITAMLSVEFGYDDTGAITRLVEQFPDSEIVNRAFDVRCTIEFTVPKSQVDNGLHLFDHLPNVEIKAI
jgi:uncharacterized YigZ family protein